MAGVIDLDSERERLEKDLQKQNGEVSRIQGKLSNESLQNRYRV